MPEVILWNAIRARKLNGARFRRQHPIGPYILDFYCDQAKLAVEIDGAVHDHPDQIGHDQRRTAWLEAQGVAVFRIPAREVLGDLESVLITLRHRTSVGPLHRP